MKFLVFGSRYWDDRWLVESVLQKARNEGHTDLVHGACRGADRIAGEIGYKMGFGIHEYPANWDLGRIAGPLRNQTMLDENDILFAVAFHDDLANAKGSGDMLRRCKRNGIKVLHVSHEEPSGVWV